MITYEVKKWHGCWIVEATQDGKVLIERRNTYDCDDARERAEAYAAAMTDRQQAI